jgi:hypothetical protein
MAQQNNIKVKIEETSNRLSVDPKLVEELKGDSCMLGRIACMVKEFCEVGDTAELGVAKLLAYYYEYRAKEAWEQCERLEESK